MPLLLTSRGMRPGARSGATHVTDVLLTNPAGTSSCPRPPKRHVREDESTNPVPETVITALVRIKG